MKFKDFISQTANISEAKSSVWDTKGFRPKLTPDGYGIPSTHEYEPSKSYPGGKVFKRKFGQDGLTTSRSGESSERAKMRKESVAEAFEYLLSLNEDEFAEVTQDGFDAYYGAYLEAKESN